MPRFPSFIVFAFALLFGVSTAHAVTEIPISIQGGMVCVKVEARGKILNFLLDSGAGRSVVDSATAKKLGLKEGTHQMVQGAEGCCTAYRVEDFDGGASGVPVPRSILALDLSPISKNTGSHIDGLLGLDFFRGRIVQIDYRARKIRLFDRSEAILTAGESVPVARRNDALCVRVSIDGGQSEWMRLDTGCSSAVEWVAGPAKLLRGGHPSIAASAGSERFVHTDVRLGSEQFSTVKTGVHEDPMFAGESGLLGNGLLSNFVVTIDSNRAKVWLRRTK